MARKRKKDTQEYWDNRLKDMALSDKHGTTSKVSYVGDSSDLEFIAGAEYTRQGRPVQKGHGPDTYE
jgi:hypothetical protein